MNNTLEINQKKFPLQPVVSHYNQTIDDQDDRDNDAYYFHDNFNNYTFSVAKQRGSTFISPMTADNSTLIEIKVGVLLPFHQNNDNWTKIMTMRYTFSFACKKLLLDILFAAAYLLFDWLLLKLMLSR